MKNIRFFLSENLQLLEVNFSVYLNRRVFVMVFLACCSVVSFYIILTLFGALGWMAAFRICGLSYAIPYLY